MAADLTRAKLVEEAKRLAREFAYADTKSVFAAETEAWHGLYAQKLAAESALHAAIDRLAADQAQGQPIEPLSVEEVQELACRHADFDASHGGTYTFNADPECRFNIHEFARDVVYEALRTPSSDGGGVGEAL